MRKFKLNIQLFAEGDTTQPPVDVQTPETPPAPEVNTPPIDDTPQPPEVNTPEQEEKVEVKEEDKPFNPDDMDFTEPEKEVDLTPYETLKEKGIDIEAPQFKANVSLLEECGMTDPEMISNFLLKVQEKQAEMSKQPTAKEIQENLRKSLTKEEQAQYKAIGNMFKTIFNNDPEAMALINRDVMSNPAMIKIVNEMRKYYTGNNKNPEPKNNAAMVKKDTATTSFEEAVNEVNAKIAAKLRENKSITPQEKQAIRNEIRNKVKSSDIQRFDNYFNY